MEDLLLSVSSPPEIDLEVFLKWIDGLAVPEITRSMRQSSGGRGNNALEFVYRKEENQHDLDSMISYEVQDQFRLYEVLEHYLMQPSLLRAHAVSVVTSDLQLFIVEKYWSVEDSFLRELLFKKLTKSRKDLEDASDNTGMSLRSITRQFDNVKRIYTAYEESSNLMDNLYQFISNAYLLSPALSKKYACVLFLQYCKFNLTTKKRLTKVTYSALENCAALVMTFLNVDGVTFARFCSTDGGYDPTLFIESNPYAWSFVWKVFAAVESIDVDKQQHVWQLLTSLRDLRTMLSGDLLDAGCNTVRSHIPPALLRRMEAGTSGFSRVRNIIKGLLMIGSNLSQTKEFRDLFEDIIGKVVEPLEEWGVTAAMDMIQIIGACYYVVQDIPESSRGSLTTSSRPDSTKSESIFQSTRATQKSAQLKLDWIRFTTFVKLALAELIMVDRR